MIRLSPKTCLLFPAVSADVIKATIFPQKKKNKKTNHQNPPSLHRTPRMLLLGSFKSMFNINPNTVFPPLSGSFRTAVLPQRRISRVQRNQTERQISVLVATCAEVEAEHTTGNLPEPWDMSHGDINNKRPLKVHIILLSVVLFVCFFFFLSGP